MARMTLCTFAYHLPAQIFSLSKLANSLKGVSSRMIRKESFPCITKNLWGGHLWSPSYFAGSCAGATIDIIKQYIHQQSMRH